MLSPERKHRCGGTLVPAQVWIEDEDGTLLLAYAVPGFECQKCHETVIERDTVRAIQRAQTPIVRGVPARSTRLDDTVSGVLVTSISTGAFAVV